MTITNDPDDIGVAEDLAAAADAIARRAYFRLTPKTRRGVRLKDLRAAALRQLEHAEPTGEPWGKEGHRHG